jgi:hypothetical protein
MIREDITATLGAIMLAISLITVIPNVPPSPEPTSIVNKLSTSGAAVVSNNPEYLQLAALQRTLHAVGKDIT